MGDQTEYTSSESPWLVPTAHRGPYEQSGACSNSASALGSEAVVRRGTRAVGQEITKRSVSSVRNENRATEQPGEFTLSRFMFTAVLSEVAMVSRIGARQNLIREDDMK